LAMTFVEQSLAEKLKAVRAQIAGHDQSFEEYKANHVARLDELKAQEAELVTFLEKRGVAPGG
jgi:hypothetical protein